MSLKLQQTIAGRPSHLSKQSFDVLQGTSYQNVVYTSSGNVVLLTPTLDLQDTLAFWSALPPRAASSSTQGVEGVKCDSDHGLILSWSSVHVVIWSHRTKRGKRKRWEVHSTLVASSPIKTLDFRKDLLILGTSQGIESWRMDESDDITVWDRLWDRSFPSPTCVRISPNGDQIAWYQQGEKSVHILSLNPKGSIIGIPQELRHPREVTWIGWRSSSTSSDSYLYTISNSVFRVYSPVLDDPSWFQLLLTLDEGSFRASMSNEKGKGKGLVGGTIMGLDADIMRDNIKKDIEGGKSLSSDVLKIIRNLEEECDLIMWIGNDGRVALRSIQNMDRKPPTLLRSTHLGSTNSQPPLSYSSDSRLLQTSTSLAVVSLDGHFNVLPISLSDLVARKSLGTSNPRKDQQLQFSQDISHFIRTPNGRGLMAVGVDGQMGLWSTDTKRTDQALHTRGSWSEKAMPPLSAIFAKGRAIVQYSKVDGAGQITLQHLDEDSETPTIPVPLPDFALDSDDELETLLAVSDIDDGSSGRGRRTQRAYIMAASRKGEAWLWRVISRFEMPPSPPTTTSQSLQSQPPEMTLLSRHTLPCEDGSPAHILPVDPMGWHQSIIDWKYDVPLQDMILTISKSGVLEFWRPELGHHFEGENAHHHDHNHPTQPWYRTGVVRTGIANAIMARCSSRKKTVMVREVNGVHELTIWDSKTSEFSTGLEITHVYPPGEVVHDLDWTTTSDLQSVLAVGFAHKVMLVCEQRLSYIEATPGWASFLKIRLDQLISTPISDSIWLAGGSLAVAAGNQVYLFSRFLDQSTSSGQSIRSRASKAELMEFGALDTTEQSDPDAPEDLFQLVATENGPLWDYHPTVLAQCLVWNKVDLVKSILTTLLEDLKLSEIEGRKRLKYHRLEPEAFFSSRKPIQKPKKAAGKYDGLFDSAPVEKDNETMENDDGDGEGDFNHRMVSDLIDRLDGPVRIPLTETEKTQLATVAQATHEVERQRRSLDLCGLRYLLSIRMFVNHRRRSGTATPANTDLPSTTSPGSEATLVDGMYRSTKFLSFRNVVWAMHSESQDILLAAATECCPNGKMFWPDANTLGVFCWLNNTEIIKNQLEVIARNRFMSDEERDPTTCSLIFFALGKKKVVHGLWRQAPQHPEQQMMLKFLANDFDLDRWKSAAVKNAYALLSKQRYEYAAAFFMLAGQPKDAITVILRHLNDWQLAFALSRAIEEGIGPISKSILTETVLVKAFEGGHRWLASWALWLLGRRDLAVRVLISPMTEVAVAWGLDEKIIIGHPANDDPSLLLIFQHLKSKSLQTAKGTNEIPEKMEFDFVLHNARVFSQLGCHALGLDLLRSWSFERPFFPVKKPFSRSRTSTRGTTPLPGTITGEVTPKTSPTSSTRLRPSPRRPSFILSAGHRRAESMVVDMDMDQLAEGDSEPVTRVPSPQPPSSKSELEALENHSKNGDAQHDLKAEHSQGPEVDAISQDKPAEVEEKPNKVGNLMKELKQDVQQGGMEFNMDDFF